MQYLLDTHTLLWFLEDNPKLPQKVKNEIVDIDNKCLISIATLWEIAIKISIGKLAIHFPFDKFALYLSDSEIDVLPISIEHLLQLLNLELHHRDPFDRLIIAQAVAEDFIILSRDENFKHYTTNLLWE